MFFVVFTVDIAQTFAQLWTIYFYFNKIFISSPFPPQTSGSVEKRADVEAALVSMLNSVCPSCQLDITLIQEGRFTKCFEKSSVTYRAQIQGTAQMTSMELVMLIQQWVLQMNSIRILSVEMLIDGQCDTIIASFEADGCTYTSPLSLPVIVGAALGGIVLLMLCLIVVLLAVFIKRRKTKLRSLALQNSGKHGLVTNKC